MAFLPFCGGTLVAPALSLACFLGEEIGDEEISLCFGCAHDWGSMHQFIDGRRLYRVE
jgi:hypothetical protein